MGELTVNRHLRKLPVRGFEGMWYSYLLLGLLVVASSLFMVNAAGGVATLEAGIGMGHHETADMACACCKKFQPQATSCSWVICNDGSGKYCWDPKGSGTACTTCRRSGNFDSARYNGHYTSPPGHRAAL